MRRNYAKQAFWRNRTCRLLLIPHSQSSSSSASSPRSFPVKSQPSDLPTDLKFWPFKLKISSIPYSNCNSGFGLSRIPTRRYASVAEEVSYTEVEEFRRSPQEKIEEEEMKRPTGRAYEVLKRRQVKLETEAWEKASNEYRQMVDDMRRQKLAPNLPYMKSLFLG